LGMGITSNSKMRAISVYAVAFGERTHLACLARCLAGQPVLVGRQNPHASRVRSQDGPPPAATWR
jgi:hypothetical protein